jgi:predicted TIM-barrel fold metal-dependent hydrolase
VSTDSHAGPSLKHDLRPYCPKHFLDAFDAFVLAAQGAPDNNAAQFISRLFGEGASPLVLEAYETTKNCPGQADMAARLRDMDADGVAAEVIFAGGENDEVLPFIGFGADAGDTAYSPELRAVGCHIWNAWLADFVSMEPYRHVGVMQIPIWDIDAAITEIRWGHGAGLRAVNFPAPRGDFPAYNDPLYEPLWRACIELNLPLVTHSGGGDTPLGVGGEGGMCLYRTELNWLSRRALWQLTFGKVFERHPDLKLVFTEQRVAWLAEALRHMDSIYEDAIVQGWSDVPPRRPSEYWVEHCYIAGSFLAPFETAMSATVGPANLMWGSDYPHTEGTWPYTRLALRHAFSSTPEAQARRILGENALAVYSLDGEKLRAIAQKVGPAPHEVSKPLSSSEIPAYRGLAFRDHGDYS